jgi:hypothetical protein
LFDDRKFVFGLGVGRCGLRSFGALLHNQPATTSTHLEWPLLSWDTSDIDAGEKILKRIQRMVASRKDAIIADAGSFYLPYVEKILDLGINAKFVCLARDKQSTIESFCRWLDRVQPLPTNHWSSVLDIGWYHDPVWSRIYPKYPISDREKCIAEYFDEYIKTSQDLESKYPDSFRIFDSKVSLNTPEGQHEILKFCGYSPPESHVLCPGLRESKTEDAQQRNGPAKFATHVDDPRRCVILVPYTGSIVPGCEEALRDLERMGYPVRRVGGYAAIDQGRNQMATDALAEGFEETIWIDSDVVFKANDVNLIRSHHAPVVCGIYPQKGKRALASHVMPSSQKITFGKEGDLSEILYAATGFLHVRRVVYQRLQDQLKLPVCNERFGRPTIPFFAPMLYGIDEGTWYLAEDYAFSQRVRDCGFKILADTRIRLWHVGSYHYGWEDAGMETPRFDVFKLNFSDRPRASAAPMSIEMSNSPMSDISEEEVVKNGKSTLLNQRPVE